MDREFETILKELDQNREATLSRTVSGKTYTRQFAQKERLTLLGAGHVSQATSKSIS